MTELENGMFHRLYSRCRNAGLLLQVTFLLSLGCLPASSLQGQQEDEYIIGTVSGQIDSSAAFSPFSNHLSSRFAGRQFTVQGFNTIESLMAAIRDGAVDFAFITPAAFIELDLDIDLRPLATITQMADGIPSPWLAGAVFTPEDRADISSLAQARGKNVVALSERALGGWLSAVREWQDIGLDATSDFSSLDFVFSYTSVIDAVCNGQADLGVIAAGTFQSLAAGCDAPLKVLPIPGIDSTAIYNLPRSTRLYPEVAFVMVREHDEEFIRLLTLTLLNIEPGSETAASVNIGGFTAPLRYTEVQSLMQELRLGPYSDIGQLTITQILRENFFVVTLILLLIIILTTVGFVRASILGRKFQQSESYRKQVFEGSHLPMVVLNSLDRIFLDMNPAAVRIYGYERKEDLIGKSVMTVTAPDQNIDVSIPEAFEHNTRKVMEEGHATFEWRHIRPDGTKWDAKIHLMSFESSDGLLIQSTLEDVTEQKQQEEERQQLEQQLEFSQRMESIGRLAGGIAHDFNNLLTIINGYSEMLLMDSAGNAPLSKTLEQIRKAGLRASDLTQQLLTFSRHQVTRHVPVNLDTIIRDCEEMFKSVLGEDIRFELTLRNVPGMVLSDPGQLQQVLLNLVVNAKDAMPTGGIVKIKTEDHFISPHSAKTLKIKPGNYVRMIISDNGTGMDSATQKHIFEPFFSTKGDAGTGLGLSTVYGIIQQSLGSISVRSTPGEGTLFTIYLPETGAEEELATIEGAQIETADDSFTILVVEDQHDVRNYVVSVLEKAGYHVLAAESGSEALNLVAAGNHHVSLLLTDVVMEGMSGGELAEKFGQLYPSTRVLFTSGYPEDDVARHGVLHGTMEFLAKPYLPKELLFRVSRILKDSRLYY